MHKIIKRGMILIVGVAVCCGVVAHASDTFDGEVTPGSSTSVNHGAVQMRPSELSVDFVTGDSSASYFDGDVTPPSAPSAAPSFTDVFPNDYYAPAVAWAVEKGVTNGTSSTTFSPNADCNRAQMVTFLWRAAGSPAPKGSAARFADVKPDDYFAQAVAWAVENGVTNGTSDAAFSPYSPVTRAQAVTFLWRAQGRPAAAAGESYADVEAGSFYADAVRWAAAKNVTKGTGESTFSPSSTVNRAMSVTFLYRAYGVT